MAAQLAIMAIGLGLSMMQNKKANAVQAQNLKGQAIQLRSDAKSLRFQAEQEKLKGTLQGIVANDELRRVQASNIVSAFARGITFSGSAVVVNEQIAKEADFFRAMEKASADATAANLRETAVDVEAQSQRADIASEQL